MSPKKKRAECNALFPDRVVPETQKAKVLFSFKLPWFPVVKMRWRFMQNAYPKHCSVWLLVGFWGFVFGLLFLTAMP